MNEFDVIRQFFQQQQPDRSDVLLGSGDDAALLQPPVDQILVASVDAMLEGVHFLVGTAAYDIGYKSVAVSLSDMAAMGAEPAWLLATLSVTEVNETWLAEFAQGFFDCMNGFDVSLVGGDLVRGPLAVSTQITGFVPPGQAITRTGAQVGDQIHLTGTIGDARLALDLLRENQPVNDSLHKRLTQPTPRIKEGIALRGIASAMIDVSDGLLADLNHLLEHRNLGARIEVSQLPLSNEFVAKGSTELALESGDDYELCFTAAPDAELPEIDCTCIGVITAQSGILCYDGDQKIDITPLGFQHF